MTGDARADGSISEAALGPPRWPALQKAKPADPTADPPIPAVGLVWPTTTQISTSFEGWAAGLSVPGYAHNVSKPFLRELWSRWGGQLGDRQRAMPHIKSYCRCAFHVSSMPRTGLCFLATLGFVSVGLEQRDVGLRKQTV